TGSAGSSRRSESLARSRRYVAPAMVAAAQTPSAGGTLPAAICQEQMKMAGTYRLTQTASASARRASWARACIRTIFGACQAGAVCWNLAGGGRGSPWKEYLMRMVMLAGAWLGVAVAAHGQPDAPGAAPALYRGHRLVEARIETPEQMRRMLEISGDCWACHPRPGLVPFRVAPERMAELRQS